MSTTNTFPEDIPLSSLEEYDSSIFRTTESIPELPVSLEGLYLDFEFADATTYNKKLNLLLENIEYIRGYTQMYDTVLPLDSEICDTFTTDALGVDFSPTHEIEFNNKEIRYYAQGILQNIITETQFGEFFNIKDVVFENNLFYILDDNFFLVLDPNDSFKLKTFFGGISDSSDKYNLNNPTKVVVSGGQIFILDKGNSRVVEYNSNFSYQKETFVRNIVSFDFFNELFFLTNTQVISEYGTFNHGVTNPRGIEVDDTQEGFLWVYSDITVNKFTRDSVFITDYDLTEFETIRDLKREGTSLFVTSSGLGVVELLDYQTTNTIISGGFGEYLHPLSSLYFEKEELNSEKVFNDCFNKIINLIIDFNNKIDGRFVSFFDSSSNLVQITTESITTTPLNVGCDFLFRQDEIVSCHTWNRVMKTIYGYLNSLLRTVLGLDEITSLSSSDASDYIPINWSLGSQKCEGVVPQLFSPNFTPISWVEMQNPALSCINICEGLVDPIIFLSDFGEETDVNHDAVGTAIMAREPLEIYHGGDTYPAGSPQSTIDGYAIFQPYIDQQKFYHIRGNHDDDYITSMSDLTDDLGSVIFDKESFGWTYKEIPNNGSFPEGWNTTTFDDSDWGQNGQAPLGYGDPEVNTVLSYGPNENNKYLTQLLRKKFDGNLITSNGLVLELEFDDGIDVFINGKLVQTWAMEYPPTPSTTALAIVGTGVSGDHRLTEGSNRITRLPVDKYFTTTGMNTIAVMLKQANGTSSDTKFDMRITNYTFPSVGVFGSLPFESEGFGDGIFSIAPYMPAKSRNYVRTVGNVDYFFMATSRDTTERNSAGSWRGDNSYSAHWLRNAVAESTSDFKFVVIHDTPVTYNSGKYRDYMDWLHEDPSLSSLTGMLHGDVHFTALTEKDNGFLIADASNFRNSARTDDGLIATDVDLWKTKFKDNTNGNGLFIEIRSNSSTCRLQFIDRFGAIAYTHTITA